VSDRGVALVATLMIAALVGGLGGALLLVTAVEGAIQSHHQQAHVAQQAVDAGLACGLAGLSATPDWDSVPETHPTAGCLTPTALPPRWPGGSEVDAARLTASLQSATTGRYGAGGDSPVWRLVDAGAPPGRAPVVVLVWVADDPEDGDGLPGQDSNGLVWLRASGFAAGGARATAEVLVRRDGMTGAAVVLGWRAVR